METLKDKNSKKFAYSLAASNHTDSDREDEDFYATPPFVVKELLKQLEIEGVKIHRTVLDPCCGMGHILDSLPEGYKKLGVDLIDRKWPGTVQKDFLSNKEHYSETDIITNPPYSIALDFMKKSLEAVDDGAIVAAFLKIQFLEGKKRYPFLVENPPLYVMPYAQRVNCGKNGIFQDEGRGNSMAMFAWFVWQKGFKGTTKLKLLNY